jgi:hypothetical protein
VTSTARGRVNRGCPQAPATFRLFSLTAGARVPSSQLPHRTRLSPLGNSAPNPIRISRRTLLKVGAAGGAALLVARCLYRPPATPPSSLQNANSLEPAARAIVAAVIPALLDGALPKGAEASSARAETLAGVERAVAGLPPATRKELAELFSLLAFAPTRCLLAGVWSPWPEATSEAIALFLTRWRDSRFTLLRSAYAALHQLVLSAWYANPRAWPAIGYPGPPSLEIG